MGARDTGICIVWCLKVWGDTKTITSRCFWNLTFHWQEPAWSYCVSFSLSLDSAAAGQAWCRDRVSELGKGFSGVLLASPFMGELLTVTLTMWQEARKGTRRYGKDGSNSNPCFSTAPWWWEAKNNNNESLLICNRGLILSLYKTGEKKSLLWKICSYINGTQMVLIGSFSLAKRHL